MFKDWLFISYISNMLQMRTRDEILLHNEGNSQNKPEMLLVSE